MPKSPYEKTKKIQPTKNPQNNKANQPTKQKSRFKKKSFPLGSYDITKQIWVQPNIHSSLATHLQ